MTDNFQRITRAKARSLSVPLGKAANAAINDAAEAASATDKDTLELAAGEELYTSPVTLAT